MRYALCVFFNGGSEGDRKPSSVSLPVGRDEDHFSRALIAQGLKRPHPPRLSPKDRGNLNGLFSPRRRRGAGPIWSCSGWGLPGYPDRSGYRWALTPPFQPYPVEWRSAIPQGGIFSVALSLPREAGVAATSRGSPRYGPPCPMELGLSSSQTRRFRVSHGKRPSLPPPFLLFLWP